MGAMAARVLRNLEKGARTVLTVGKLSKGTGKKERHGQRRKCAPKNFVFAPQFRVPDLFLVGLLSFVPTPARVLMTNRKCNRALLYLAY